MFLLQHVCVIWWRAEIPTVCTWPFIIHSWELHTRNFVRCLWTFFFVNYTTTFNSSPLFWGHSKRSKKVTNYWSNCTGEQQTLQKHSVAPGKPQGSALAILSQGKHSSPAATCQKLSCCKFENFMVLTLWERYGPFSPWLLPARAHWDIFTEYCRQQSTSWT